MKFVAISDTHGQHKKLNLPDTDAIIHAGDISKRGTVKEIQDFLDWYSRLDYKYKIFIAGNHDFFFERENLDVVDQMIASNIIYLNDSGVEIEGIRLWGSPVQPWFHDWAFNKNRGAEIRKHWDLIPDHTDILITHGPAANILDRTVYGEHVGCEDLRLRVEQVKPKFHIVGHIHESYGSMVIDDTHFINASVLNVGYNLVNDPIVFEL